MSLCAYVSPGDSSVLLLYLMYEPREFTTAMFGVFNSAKMFLLVSGFVSTEFVSNESCLFLTRSKHRSQHILKMPVVVHTRFIHTPK